ncbi:MAG: prolipoprotein diacylglyceryl transferase [Clostridia bacterium]|nr:prolipoprotein diacylglyceryl transferase [Clostridia bacterium]
MIPVFNLFGKDISIYLIMGLVGVFAMLPFGMRTTKKDGLDENQMLAMFCYSFIGIIAGGHLMFGITQFDKIAALLRNFNQIGSFKQFVAVLTVIFGGSVYYGGLTGVLIIGYLFCKARKLETGRYFDIGAMSICLFHFFGRIGCFLGGCCYGIEWKYGFIYHHSPVEACNGVPRFPVQLVEAVLNLLLFFFLFYCFGNRLFRKKLMGLYCLIYPVYRFVLEYYRADEYRGFLGALSTSQIISLIYIVVTIIILLFLDRQNRRKV